MPLAQRLLPPPLGNTSGFRAGPQLRDEWEVWAALEETIEMHWTFRDAHLNNRPAPEGLMIDVVVERHHALRWLSDLETDWDEVTLDT